MGRSMDSCGTKTNLKRSSKNMFKSEKPSQKLCFKMYVNGHQARTDLTQVCKSIIGYFNLASYLISESDEFEL